MQKLGDKTDAHLCQVTPRLRLMDISVLAVWGAEEWALSGDGPFITSDEKVLDLLHVLQLYTIMNTIKSF